MRILKIPIFNDNYSYLLECKKTHLTALIDPADSRVFSDFKKFAETPFSAILCTHHHQDHSGGKIELLKLYPDIKIYGADDRIPGLTHKLQDNVSFMLGELKITSSKFC